MDSNMKIIGCMATYEGRAKTRHRAINSIKNQLDFLYVVDNAEHEIDRADNAKFEMLDKIKQPCYYLTLDDDLEYPPDYVENIVTKVKEYGCIVSYHGRQLLGIGHHYYKGHTAFRCLDHVGHDEEIDVPGTGVMAFDTRYFHPKGLANSPDLRMADLVFALEAAKQGKQIGVLAHEAGWIKHIPNKETIYATETRNGIQRQNQLADEIYKLRHESNT